MVMAAYHLMYLFYLCFYLFLYSHLSTHTSCPMQNLNPHEPIFAQNRPARAIPNTPVMAGNLDQLMSLVSLLHEIHYFIYDTDDI